MKGRLYAIEKRTVIGLLETRRQLMAAAKGMKAEDMRIAISDIYAAARIYRTPETAEGLAGVYNIDKDGIAHIPVVGILTSNVDPCAAFFEEAETEYGFIQAAVRKADHDLMVAGISLEIDSPGGYIDGVDETAQVIMATEKPVTARVHNMAASAAYWLASQADRIVASSPADQIGSIGVVVEEYNDDESLAKAGIMHRVYTSTDAPDKRPDTNTEEGRAKIIAMLDDLHGVFVSRVAAGRHTTAERVNADFGHGGLLIAADAVKVGMIDEVLGTIKNPGVAGEKTAAKADGKSKTGRGTMTLEELKRDHPELYAAVLATGREAGITEERKRIAKLQAWADSDPVCTEIVAKAIVSGETAEDVMPQLMAAIKKSSQPEGKAPENPPQVHTGQTTTGSGEGEKIDDAKIKETLARLPA